VINHAARPNSRQAIDSKPARTREAGVATRRRRRRRLSLFRHAPARALRTSRLLVASEHQRLKRMIALFAHIFKKRIVSPPVCLSSAPAAQNLAGAAASTFRSFSVRFSRPTRDIFFQHLVHLDLDAILIHRWGNGRANRFGRLLTIDAQVRPHQPARVARKLGQSDMIRQCCL